MVKTRSLWSLWVTIIVSVVTTRVRIRKVMKKTKGKAGVWGKSQIAFMILGMGLIIRRM